MITDFIFHLKEIYYYFLFYLLFLDNFSSINAFHLLFAILYYCIFKFHVKAIRFLSDQPFLFRFVFHFRKSKALPDFLIQCLKSTNDAPQLVCLWCFALLIPILIIKIQALLVNFSDELPHYFVSLEKSLKILEN